MWVSEGMNKIERHFSFSYGQPLKMIVDQLERTDLTSYYSHISRLLWFFNL